MTRTGGIILACISVFALYCGYKALDSSIRIDNLRETVHSLDAANQGNIAAVAERDSQIEALKKMQTTRLTQIAELQQSVSQQRGLREDCTAKFNDNLGRALSVEKERQRVMLAREMRAEAAAKRVTLMQLMKRK